LQDEADGLGLKALLSAAAAAEPGERIEFRDSIVAFGRESIAPMASWLGDRRLGGFAVRVLVRIGEEPQYANVVLDVLQSIDRDTLTDPLSRDVSDAVGRIKSYGRTVWSPGAQRARDEPWPGEHRPAALQLRFHEAMLDVFRLAGEATRQRRLDGTTARGYWATYFLRGVRRHGGQEYARRLLRMAGLTEGFRRLEKEGRLDLSMEALVLRPEYAGLFTDTELSIAARRLGGRRPTGPRTDPADES